jgi:hypothetical protein
MTSDNTPTLNEPREEITAGIKGAAPRHTADTINDDDLDQLYAAIARVRAYAQTAIDAGDTGPGPALGRLLLQLLDGEQTATEATRPATWLTAGTRDLSIPAQHQVTVRPVDPEEERAATERARRVAAEAQRATEQLAALDGQEQP